MLFGGPVNSSYSTSSQYSSSNVQEQGGQEQATPVVRPAKVFDAAILEHITEAFIALDHQWCITYVNQSAAMLMQRALQEVVGKNLWEIFPEIVGSTFYHTCQEALATGKTRQYEVRSQRHEKWMHIRIFPSADDITIFLSDITAQREAQEQQQFQANILQHIRDSVIVTDLQGIITYWNEGAGGIFGYTPEEMVGQTIAWVYLEQDAHQMENHLRCIAEGRDYSGEWQGRRKDGAAIWLNVKMTLIRNEEGEACGFLGVAKDITRRKRIDEELRRSKEQLEVILKNVDDGIIVQDVIGKIIYANPVVAKRVGYASAEEMLAVPPSAYWERVELTNEKGEPFPLAQLPGRRALQGEVNPQVSIRYINKQTHEVGWTLIKSMVVFERDDTPSLVISVLQDITQFKELEQHKDEFLMHVSHELRTPLTSLVGFLELLKEFGMQLDEPKKDKFLLQAIENCHELTFLVNEVLDVMRFQHNTKPAQPSKLSLAAEVRAVLEQLDPRNTQYYTFKVEIAEQLTVWGDQKYLRQVLRNLLSNACKYSPQRTVVTISTTPDERSEYGTEAVPKVCIAVQDAGPGIPLAEQPLLFDKFIRLKRDLVSSVRGTGLGLYICKQLVGLMGERIWVESSGRAGEGSRFCFTLPLAAQAPNPV